MLTEIIGEVYLLMFFFGMEALSIIGGEQKMKNITSKR
jgi:hypothetical protein